ncbi:MAG TPA: flagellar biosynthesis protein FlhA [Bdellovibrionales bacterium]|nr:flagellar biosynthesis protein FlhA [Pseudobdellovibrionaceae bacterium]HAG91651.1 flagellar biosynthesis protein FlhA [Bdellovibrionales bacterium]|tara:strand:+ start:932 stop:3028 length:2097 start_codon:yes stop_codon:yes gene_type:complete
MEAIFQFLKRFERFTKNMDLLMAAGLIGILVVMLIPLPPVLLDMALTMSLALSLLVLLVAIYTDKALDFSIFPSLLLMTTLFRLALNVASTRLILTEGHKGKEAVGDVIQAFGHFVVGDSYVVGLVVFVILVVINFIVITKGSGRVAEVAARFTLDAMPGKQMSIDADLNSGLISEDDARKRRKEIENEADFYGSMDGASKFVRGDAIAGIIITGVNIVGGLIIGVLQKDLDLSTAAKFYTTLTIGDGLVSQIPALIISTAAGIVVTRNSSSQNLGSEMAGQLFIKPRAVQIAAGILIFLSLVPGIPTFPFFLMGGILLAVAWATERFSKDRVERERMKADEEALKPQKENIESLLPLDLVELEVGYGLINIVESEQSGDLLERIVSIRKQFAMDLGIIVPSVHIRDNLQLQPGEYRVLIKGNKVGGGNLRPDSMLAMDPGNVISEVPGIQTKEPAFGLDALWISKSQKEEAEMAGYTVVDLPTVMATHLTELIRTHAHELFGRQEADKLVENFKKTNPKVVQDLIPDILTLGQVVKVLQNLLKEQVSIRDLVTIFETLADEGSRNKDSEVLTEAVRKSLARAITHKYLSEDGTLSVMTLAPETEELVSNSLLQTDQGVQLVMDPMQAQDLLQRTSLLIETHPEIAGQPILLTSPTARRHLAKLTHRFLPQVIVLSHNEVSSDAQIQSVGQVELNNAG